MFQLISIKPDNQVYRKLSNIRYTKYKQLKWLSSPVAVVLAQSIEARCLVENEGVFGAAPTGDAPTSCEWSTSILPAKMRVILESWWQSSWSPISDALYSKYLPVMPYSLDVQDGARGIVPRIYLFNVTNVSEMTLTRTYTHSHTHIYIHGNMFFNSWKLSESCSLPYIILLSSFLVDTLSRRFSAME